MRVLLVGYGKMGKIIERVAIERGHTIAGRIDIDNQHEIATVDADVAIEFSRPEAAFNNIKRVLERGIPVVCGTTGWLDQKPEAEKICLANNTAFFYASNYSLGVNIFFKVNEYLAKLMNGLNDYEITMDEIHHTEKKDAPSGTAITLAEGILKNINRKKTWVNDQAKEASDLLIKSFRIDQVPGTHLVNYSSAIDNIEIKHIAHSREGFAKGAVLVAEWLKDKKGILNMDDFLKF
ncbi:MAG TPA: 4-hydroxy-tetrahydrodipicolinate reductase [Cyclobacteriaceae bacterium]|jgi:4-hydroxy-tetrahydrodipicolinate reductase|nr:4-hydroxy-tetrahydrodipicolinate reductase [Cyclobacteriaceae bacterium]